MATLQTLQLRDANGEFPVIEFLYPMRYDRSSFANPAGESANMVLTMVHGSWTSTPIDDNRVREEFMVEAIRRDTNVLRRVVRDVSRMLHDAARLQANGSFGNEIRLWHKASDEPLQRTAFVYSGSIEEADHAILHRGLWRSPDAIINNRLRVSATYKVTIIRDMYWEIYKDTEVADYLWEDLSTHGGHKIIAAGAYPGDVPPRVKLLRIASHGGFIGRVWMGVKEANSGSLFQAWSPKISCGQSYEIMGNSGAIQWPFSGGDASDFLDESGLLIRYFYNLNPSVSWAEWRYHVHFQITKWNAITATSANLDNYYGSYHLLLRYKTSDIGNAKIGIRAATGYRYLTNLTPLERIYLENTDNEFQYVNLGRMTIGGEGWTQDMRRRIFIEGFRIYIESALIDGDFENDRLYLDNMYLVPADHYCAFDLGGGRAPEGSTVEYRAFAGGARAEIYQHVDNSVSGFIVGRYEDGTTIPLETREVLYGISDMTTENWGWAVENGSIFVIVADREPGKTKVTTAQAIVDVLLARRVTGYSS